METVKIELDDSALDEALEKSEKLVQNNDCPAFGRTVKKR